MSKGKTPAQPMSPSWRRRLLRHPGLWLSLILVALSLALYAPVFGYDFVNYDDPFYVTQNAHVKAGLTLPGLHWAFTSLLAFWHPLTWLSLELDASLFGMNPAGFHGTNLLLHTMNSVLLFWVLRGWTGNTGRSAAVALLFALHPLHVETVAWVSERKGLLSTLFGLLAVGGYGWYVQRPGLGRYLLVLAALMLGLMAKPMLVTLPLVFGLLDYWPAKRCQNALWLALEKLLLLLPALATCWLTVVAEEKVGAVDLHDQVSWSVRLGDALVAYVQYHGMTIWPSGLTVCYPRPLAPAPWEVALAAGAFLVFILGLVLSQVRQRPYLTVGWLWFVGTLVPIIGLVQVGSHLLADRYTYWPHIGLLTMVVWAAADLMARWKAESARAPLLVGLAVACFLVSRQQLSYWHDSRSLWTHALKVTPNNEIAHNGLGLALRDQGLLAEAVSEFHEALHICPDYWEAHNNLGLICLIQGNHTQAEVHFSQAVNWQDHRPDLHANLGAALYNQGRLAESIEQLTRAVQLDPEYTAGHVKLGAALQRQGQLDEALSQDEEALRLDPHQAEAHNQRGMVLETLGRSSEAIACYRQALFLEPRSLRYRCNLASALYDQGEQESAQEFYREADRLQPGWPATFNGIARHLATASDPRLRFGCLAMRLARQACQATGFQNPDFLQTLAVSCEEARGLKNATSQARTP